LVWIFFDYWQTYVFCILVFLEFYIRVIKNIYYTQRKTANNVLLNNFFSKNNGYMEFFYFFADMPPR